MSKKLTKAEKMLGRSGAYHLMSPQEQWADDKKNGILDWDGSKEEADKIAIKKQMGPVLGELTPNDVALAILERLEMTGYGKKGESNTLAGMVMQLCDEVEALRKQVEELKKNQATSGV